METFAVGAYVVVATAILILGCAYIWPCRNAYESYDYYILLNIVMIFVAVLWPLVLIILLAAWLCSLGEEPRPADSFMANLKTRE